VLKIRPIRMIYLIGLLVSIIAVHTYTWAVIAFCLSHFDVGMRD